LGMPPRHPFFIGKNQVTFQHTIFLLLRFSLLSFNECSLFLELRLAFIFCLDFYSDLVISLHQGVFWPLVHVGCNIPRFYQILGEIFLFLFCLRWLKFTWI
jgi:hypothetical protein